MPARLKRNRPTNKSSGDLQRPATSRIYVTTASSRLVSSRFFWRREELCRPPRLVSFVCVAARFAQAKQSRPPKAATSIHHNNNNNNHDVVVHSAAAETTETVLIIGAFMIDQLASHRHTNSAWLAPADQHSFNAAVATAATAQMHLSPSHSAPLFNVAEALVYAARLQAN